MTKERFEGTLYRALNPLYAREPLSGRGAALYGGRFNARGQEVLYASLDVRTALREANQVGMLQPTTIVAYRADLSPIFDTRDTKKLAKYDMTETMLAANDWRDAMRRRTEVPTQKFTDRLRDDGIVGLLVRSFAKATTADDLNLVILRWNTGRNNKIEVVDDERRLG